MFCWFTTQDALNAKEPLLVVPFSSDSWVLTVKRAALVASALLAVSSAVAAAPQPTRATIVRGGGCVREAVGQTCNPVSAEIMTGLQGSFAAGTEGAKLELSDHSTVTLDPNAEIRVLPTMSVSLATPIWAQVVQLLKGRVECSVATKPSAPTAVVVRGPATITAVIKSGTSVLRLVNGRLILGVLSGAGLAAAKNDWGDVAEHKVRVLALSDEKIPLRSFIEAPVLEATHSLEVQQGQPQGKSI